MKITYFIITLLFTTAFVNAQECSEDLALVNSLFEKLNVEQALADPSAISAEFDNLKSSLGNISIMSLKKDSPKLLFLNGKEKKGNVKAGKKRIYITSLIQKDAFNIQLKNSTAVDGQIIICAHAQNGTIENIENARINANSTPEAMNFNITGQRGKVVSITIKNASAKEKLAFVLQGAYL